MPAVAGPSCASGSPGREDYPGSQVEHVFYLRRGRAATGLVVLSAAVPVRPSVGTWPGDGRLDALRPPARAGGARRHGPEVGALPRAGVPFDLVQAPSRERGFACRSLSARCARDPDYGVHVRKRK